MLQAILGTLGLIGAAGLVVAAPSVLSGMVAVGAMAGLRGVKRTLTIREGIICKELYEVAGDFALPKGKLLNRTRETAEAGNINLTIFNHMGQRLQSESWTEFKGSFKEQIDLNDYATGMYFIQLKVDDIRVDKKLLIKRD